MASGNEAQGLEGILHPIGVFVDPIFAPLTIFPPYVTILIMSIILTALIMGISRIFVNRKMMIQIKEQMEEIKERLNVAQKSGSKEEQNKYLSELMKANSSYMRHTMKIMAVSVVVVILFFPWLSFRYSGVAAVELPFTLPFVGWNSLEWFWWYVLAAFAVGAVMRKIIGSDI